MIYLLPTCLIIYSWSNGKHIWLMSKNKRTHKWKNRNRIYELFLLLLLFYFTSEILTVTMWRPTLNSNPVPLTPVRDALKMEIRVKVSSRQTEPISSSFMGFLSWIFISFFLGRGLLLRCQQTGKATVMLLFYASCGQSVFVLRYHQENFLFFYDPQCHFSHQKTLLTPDLQPGVKPPDLHSTLQLNPRWCWFHNCRKIH